MYQNPDVEDYICQNVDCFVVVGNFPRYKATYDARKNLVYRAYALDKFYVRVFVDHSSIYHLKGSMLFDGVSVPRSLWLDPTNFAQDLDKLKNKIRLFALLS
jgi:hypothetical protein